MQIARRVLGRVHWAWVPAAVFYSVVGWQRYGPLPTVLANVVGIGLGLYLERRARARRARG